MKTKEYYLKPQIEIVEISSEDIIAISSEEIVIKEEEYIGPAGVSKRNFWKDEN